MAVLFITNSGFFDVDNFTKDSQFLGGSMGLLSWELEKMILNVPSGSPYPSIYFYSDCAVHPPANLMMNLFSLQSKDL